MIFIHFICQQQCQLHLLTVKMVILDLKGLPMPTKGELSCASTMPGGHYVTMVGIALMETLCANNWASNHLVRCVDRI